MNIRALKKLGLRPNLSPDKKFGVAKKTESAMILLGYKQTPIGLIASLFCSVIIFIGMFDMPNKMILYTWFGVFLLTILLRSQFVIYYNGTPNPAETLTKWRNLFILGALLGGVLWGITGFIFYPKVDSLQQTLLLLILAGTSAGSVPLYSPVLWAGRGFLVITLLPVIIVLTMTHNYYNLLLDATITAYLVYLIALCQRSHNSIRESIGLQYENVALLDNLSEAKHELEKINKKLEQAATHDPLTNVANRNLFVTSFDQAIERAKQNKKLLALLYIDLDNFKNINDVYGHHIGDQLLLILTERLEEFVEPPDIIARLGGDEFTMIIENFSNPHDIAKLARKICRVTAEPVRIRDLDLKVSASVGIGVYPIDGDDAEKLLNVADKAMYYIKERGGNNFRFNVTLLTK